MSDVKKTIIEEALIDFDAVYKEAEQIAKEKLASSMPDKFESLVEQHLKNKNKINESDEQQEPSMADEKESVKESFEDENQEVSETEKVDMTQATIDEIEEAYDNLSLDEIEIMREAEGDDDIEVKDVENEIDSMSEMVDELEAQEQPVTEESNDPYSKLKQMHEEMSKMLEAIESEKADSQLREAFNAKMKGVYGESFEEALGEQERVKMFEAFKKLSKNAPVKPIAEEEEIAESAKDGHVLATKGGKLSKTAPVKQIAEDEIAEGAKDGHVLATKGGKLTKSAPVKQIAEDEVSEAAKDGHVLATKGGKLSKSAPVKPISEEEEVVDEAHGIALSHNKLTGQESQPSVDGAKSYAKDKVRLALQKESEDKAKKIANLLKEQKELTKKVNQMKKEKSELVGINEGFKKTLNEMKDQMKKMAVFNTNIAHVNNLLVNEDFALTKDEKIYIIEKFKKVTSITESDATHKVLIEEFKTSKKKLDESIEKKITENVGGESSANILESKIVEKTAFEKQVDKMKNIINYAEKRRK
jgi:hypothetical protein